MQNMTKEEFRTRWESDDEGGGINFEDIADCAVAWGVCSKPKIRAILLVRYQVLVAAGASDAEEFKPEEDS